MRNLSRSEEDIREFVAQKFYNKGYPTKSVYREKTTDKDIQLAMKNASKKGFGEGRADIYIIDKNTQTLIIVECKNNKTKHKSLNFNTGAQTSQDVVNYACDGITHYGKYLYDLYNVVCIAASGTDEDDILIDTYLYKKGCPQYEDLNIHEILKINDYIKKILGIDGFINAKQEDLMKYAKTLHNEMRDYANMTEAEKPLLVSGILIALQDELFNDGLDNITHPFFDNDEDATNPNILSVKLYDTIEGVLKKRKINNEKLVSLMSVYSFIKAKTEFRKIDKKLGINPLRKFINDIRNNVGDYITPNNSVDVIGKFYGEFVRYTGGGWKRTWNCIDPSSYSKFIL